MSDKTNDKPLLQQGEVLDDTWRIDEPIGAGGMAVVFRATHIRNGREVAVKALRPEVALDDDLRERFLKEGYAANRVGHPGTVQVLDDGTASTGLVYLVMELLDGQTLDEKMETRGGTVPAWEALRIFRDVCNILAAAHEKGIVHRDVKPENIWITPDNRTKLLDFGIARVREHPSSKTTMGSAMGTPAFMPPEQALAHWDRVGPASDVYSVAASMFTALTGLTIHDGATLPELLVRTCTRPAPPVLSLEPTLPRDLAAVLDRALSYEPADRYLDAASLEGALDRVKLDGALDATLLQDAMPSPVPSPEPKEPVTLAPSFETLPDRIVLPKRRSVAGWALGITAALGLAGASLSSLAEHDTPTARPNVVPIPSESSPPAHWVSPSQRGSALPTSATPSALTSSPLMPSPSRRTEDVGESGSPPRLPARPSGSSIPSMAPRRTDPLKRY
jgi:eukaryotic-like serine/threonine-protein kinase